MHNILDTNELSIVSVVNADSREVLQHTVSPAQFGSKLEIAIPQCCSQQNGPFKVSIDYTTSCGAPAVQWLDPIQTAGKQHPYLFTQCQITVPCQLTALMSARLTQKEPEGSTNVVYKFEQNIPIPSYLVALVIGALDCRRIGPRSMVWSEKEIVDSAQNEFAMTEQMLKAAESAVGPYIWGQYDLLVLPPSFPYGGMENPCITFVTPTLLAGDRSLTYVVAHEISHSWTGNLVTNSNWEHFWLNEGFTTYLERRIVAKLAGEQERHLHAIDGWKRLDESVEHFGVNKLELTALCPKLDGVDPDDAFSAVPYEKGFNLLYYLETLVGGPAIMESFLKAYVEKFKFQSITTDDWKTFFLSHFSTEASSGVFDNVEWDKWLHGYGMPPITPCLDTSLADISNRLADKWADIKDVSLVQETFSYDDIATMSSMQVQVFLNSLLGKASLSRALLRAMNDVYAFSQSKNSEITFRWLKLCLKAGENDVFPEVVNFITKQGRMKYVRPLYRELSKCPGGQQVAKDTFAQHKSFYHKIAANMIEKDLGLV
eukprot:Em0001g1109a